MAEAVFGTLSSAWVAAGLGLESDSSPCCVAVVGGGRSRRVPGVVCRTCLGDWAVVFEMNKVETVCTGVSVFYNGNVCN